MFSLHLRYLGDYRLMFKLCVIQENHRRIQVGGAAESFDMSIVY